MSEADHCKAVANPESAPSSWAFGHFSRLAVNCDCVGRYVADDAAANVLRDLLTGYRHHGNGGRRRQPIGLIVSAGVVAYFVEITEHERHRIETLKTRTGPT